MGGIIRRSTSSIEKENYMLRRGVAFVVGHEKWGKSHTLRALHARYGRGANHVFIGKKTEFFVRKSSNDDITKKRPERMHSYINFMRSLSRPYVIAALCPKFKKLRNYNLPKKAADDILRRLRVKGYKLFFWVIKYRWGKPSCRISRWEITQLRRYGKVKIFKGINVEDRERAKYFRAFVLSVL